MQIHAWDEVFVRATRREVNALVSRPDTWSAWWPGCRTSPGDGVVAVSWRSAFPLPAHHRLVVRVDRVRPRDKGLEFSVSGDVEGSGEWFHVDQPNGVVVHHLLRGGCTRRMPLLWRAAHRAIVRAGLTSLKDRLEGGRTPGAEPDPLLQAAQARELDIFALELAKHEAEQALDRLREDG